MFDELGATVQIMIEECKGVASVTKRDDIVF